MAEYDDGPAVLMFRLTMIGTRYHLGPGLANWRGRGKIGKIGAVAEPRMPDRPIKRDKEAGPIVRATLMSFGHWESAHQRHRGHAGVILVVRTRMPIRSLYQIPMVGSLAAG